MIYVQNVPTVAVDPNYHAPGVDARSAASPATEDGRIPIRTARSAVGYGNGIGYPTANERMRRNNAYECRTGDVFVQGTLDGQMTIAAEKYIYVTGDILYEDANDDMLGLIGTDAIWIWNPVNSSQPVRSWAAPTVASMRPCSRSRTPCRCRTTTSAATAAR